MPDTKVSDYTPRPIPELTDVIPVVTNPADGVDYISSIQEIIRANIGLEIATGADNFLLNPGDNTIDSASATNTITGSGSASFPNKIGELNGLPAGVGQDPGWVADAAYVAGAASVSSIVSGYDNINNAPGSTVLGNHHMIAYSVDGHNIIAGGSYCYIAGERSSIVNSRDAAIMAGALFGGIWGGDVQRITGTGNYSNIFGGTANTIDSDQNGCAIVSSQNGLISDGLWAALLATTNCTINTTNSAAAIVGAGGSSITGSANYVGILGDLGSEITSSYSAIVGGRDCLVQHFYSNASGRDAVTKAGSSSVLSAGKLVNQGDAQLDIVNFTLRTTGATLTNMTTGDGFLVLDDAKQSAIGGTLIVTGIREDTGAGCAYKLDFLATWNGASININGSGGTPTLDLIHNNAGVLTAPTLSGSAGSIRPKVTGLAGVNFKWSAAMNIASVNV